MPIPVNQAQQLIVGSTGTLNFTLGPAPAGYTWSVIVIILPYGSTQPVAGNFQVTAGAVTIMNGPYQGPFGPITVFPGENIYVQLTGATPNSQIVVQVRGNAFLPSESVPFEWPTPIGSAGLQTGGSVVGLPAGGAAGLPLVKSSANNYDATWQRLTSAGVDVSIWTAHGPSIVGGQDLNNYATSGSWEIAVTTVGNCPQWITTPAQLTVTANLNDATCTQIITDAAGGVAVRSLQLGGSWSNWVTIDYPAFVNMQLASMSLPSTPMTTITFTGTVKSSSPNYSIFISTINNQLAPNVRGIWLFVTTVFFNNAATGRRAVRLLKNGVNVIGQQEGAFTANSSLTQVAAMCPMNGTSDYVAVQGYQTSGASQSIGPDANSNPHDFSCSLLASY